MTTNYWPTATCSGSDPTIFAARTCTVAMTVFTQTILSGGLYELTLGTPIIAVV